MPHSLHSSAQSRPSAIRITLWICFGLLWLIATLCVLQVGSNVLLSNAVGQNLSASTTIDDGLRYTTMGWQDPTDWMPQPRQGSHIHLSSVSPLIWAAMLLLAVGIAVIWLSSEDEVERMFREKFEHADLMAKLESQNQATASKR